jgi:hypothetical protein
MMFRSRHPLQALQGLQALQALQHVPLRLVGARRAVRRSPSLVHILLAGAAVLAFASLLSQASRPGRSRGTKIAFGVLLLALGAVVLSLRRSGRRYRF